MRASDAERTEVADRLSKHYQDGRLDQAEFNERLDRAMNAKTRADFSGLFADLPDLPDVADQPPHAGYQGPGPARNGTARTSPVRFGPRHRPGFPLTQLLTICAVAVIAIVVAHSVMHSWLLWLLLAIVGFIWLRNEDNRRRRR
jgi:hypothetical protein